MHSSSIGYLLEGSVGLNPLSNRFLRPLTRNSAGRPPYQYIIIIDKFSLLNYSQTMQDPVSKQTTTQPSRVARRRARVRADLLAAARQVFTKHGYQDATITEIVQVADIAMGTFYLHFGGKEELLVALAQETLQVIREQVHAAIEQHADEPLVPLIIRTLLRTAYEQRDLFLLLGAGESQLLAHTHMLRGQVGLAEHFISVLQETAETGQLASYDPVLLAHLLVGMLNGAMNWWFEQDEPGPEVMADHILFVLGHGLPASFLTGTWHFTPQRGVSENWQGQEPHR
jgi:AcrR family transcriptional regulator